MRHRLPVTRQQAIRWLGRAFALIGLVALLALPFASGSGGGIMHRQLAGIGQLDKALPAELRSTRTAAVAPEKSTGGGEPALEGSAGVPQRGGPVARHLPWPAERTANARTPFLHPVSQAPPSVI